MRLYKGVLNVGGSLLNQVPKTFTAAEAIVLQTLHGTDALNKIEPLDEKALAWSPDEDFTPDADDIRTPAQERSRLQFTYGVALSRLPQSNVDGLFGIASMPLPDTIEGVDEKPAPKKKPAPRRKKLPPAPEVSSSEGELGELVA